MFHPNNFMNIALAEAKKAQSINEVPVGAVITYQNQIIAKSHNCNISNCDPLAHAEILAISLASKYLNKKYLDQCEIYITLEPCLMCMGAISLARIAKIYYGLADTKFGAIESNNLFWQNNKSYFRPEIYGNICEEQSRSLMQDFFRNKRLKK